MATPYEKIYERVLPKFRSYEIPLMGLDDAKKYLRDFLASAVPKFYICKKDLSNMDDEKEQFGCDLSDEEIEILSNYIVIDYIDAVYIRTPTLLKPNLSVKDFNAFSSANMLSQINKTQERYISENEAAVSRYSWLNNSGEERDRLKNNVKGGR